MTAPDVWHLTRAGLDRWRAQAGEAGIAAWCRLHSIDPDRVTLDPPPRIEGTTVTGRAYVVDGDGRKIPNGPGQPLTVPFLRDLIAPPPPCALERR